LAARESPQLFRAGNFRMPATTWKLIDDKNLIRQPQAPFRAAGNNAHDQWSVTGTAYEDGLRAGVDVVEIANGRLRLDVIPTQGWAFIASL